MSTSLFALAALLLVNGAWLYYLWLIPREQVPRRPYAVLVAMALGALVALAVVWRMARGGWSIIALALVLVTLALAGFFVFLLRLAPLPDGDVRVKLGGALLPFEAVDADGHAFSSAELAGKRVLLKFFRGHW